MNKARKLTILMATASVMATLSATSVFADSRHQDETWRRADTNTNQIADRRAFRENDRVTLEGRVTSVTRDRGGYRVQLDRDSYWYWVPERALRNRGRDLRVGISIRIGGVFRGGIINVEVIDFPTGGYGGGYYSYNYVRGVVDRIDFRRGFVVVRENSGRFVGVDMTRTEPRSIDLDDLHRGDFVEISGDWIRGDFFQARRVESVRARRY